MKENLRSLWIILLAILLLAFSLPRVVHAQSSSSFPLYPGGNESDDVQASQPTYSVFFDQTYTYSYSGGSVCLSSQSGRCASPAIDDYVIIWINGNKIVDQKSETHDFGPVDFTPFLRNGDNQIRVQLIDLMGPTRGGSALWLVLTGGGTKIQPTQTPFQESLSPGTLSPEMLSFYLTPHPPDSCPGFIQMTISTQNVEIISLSENGHVWMREGPSFSAKIIGESPTNTSFTVDKYACAEGYTWEHQVGFDYPQGSTGWSGWVAVYNLGSETMVPTPGYSMPTQESTAVSPLPEQAQNSTDESWDTSINECEVNPLLYEFYKDQNNQLKLVMAHASGIIDAINNFFAWIGFLIDSSKVKFEPTADEVKVSLFYSSEGHFRIQADRYLQGQLLSTDTEQIDQSTYNNYLKNLGSCGINT